MPAIDTFEDYSSSSEGPVQHAVAVVPNDTADLTHLSRVLYVGGVGDVRLSLKDGSTVTFRAMEQGWHPIRAARIYATGTTATDMIAGW